MNTAHIVIAPDSFKGSVSAREAAQALARGLTRALPHARLTCAPMADGGEGTLDCVAGALAGRSMRTRIRAIHGDAMNAHWYLGDDGRGYIESAQALGLPLIQAHAAPPPLHGRGSAALASLIGDVLDAGVHEFFIGLGGTACNDAGLGLLTALGARALDRRGVDVAATMAGLLQLDALDLSGLDARLAQTRIHALCDVDNPLLGAHGASRVYGPQKGLDDAEIDAVEAAFARLAERAGASPSARCAGSGAAGGLGFALALLGAQLHPGADTLIRMTGLPALLAEADLIVTGEGRSDAQTLSGKLPLAIARSGAPTPTVLVSGAITADARPALAGEFTACVSLTELAGNTHNALREPLKWLEIAGHDAGRQWSAVRNPR